MKKKMMFFIAVVVVATTFTSCGTRYIVDRSMGGGCGVWYPRNPEREARREARRSYSNVSPGRNFGW